MGAFFGDKESKSQRDKETKRQRVKKTKSRKVKESKSQRVEKTKRQRVKETKSGRDKGTKRQGLPQPLPKGKGFVAALMHRTWGSFLGDKETERGRVGGRGLAWRAVL